VVVARSHPGRNSEEVGAANVERHQARPGVRVRVAEDYRNPQLRGALGTVQQIWGNPHYSTALLVRLEDARYELFWHHELQIAEEEAIGA
jgi:hypothetical protein